MNVRQLIEKLNDLVAEIEGFEELPVTAYDEARNTVFDVESIERNSDEGDEALIVLVIRDSGE